MKIKLFNMGKKVLYFVVNVPGKELQKVTQELKDKYVTSEKDLCLGVITTHGQGAHVVADGVKSRKPELLVFDGVSHENILAIKDAIKRRMNGSTPKMAILGLSNAPEGFSEALNHNAVKVLLN